jgi:hypothetical protein
VKTDFIVAQSVSVPALFQHTAGATVRVRFVFVSASGQLRAVYSADQSVIGVRADSARIATPVATGRCQCARSSMAQPIRPARSDYGPAHRVPLDCRAFDLVEGKTGILHQC